MIGKLCALIPLTAAPFPIEKRTRTEPPPLKTRFAVPRSIRPPPGVDFATNPTVFGAILRGDAPSTRYSETDGLYCFADERPRAPLHALVIPKRYVPTIRQLLSSDYNLLSEMRDMALDVIGRERPDALRRGDYLLCFHVPPFNSVDHLHLHVLAPASEISYWARNSKYRVGTMWCTGIEDAITRLKTGKNAMPPFDMF